MLSLFLSHKIEQPFNWKGRRERERNRLNRLNNPLLKDGSGEDAQLIWGEQKLRGITKEISGRRSNYPKESERKVALGNLRLAAHSANWTDRITPNSSSVSGFGRSDDDLTSARASTFQMTLSLPSVKLRFLRIIWLQASAQDANRRRALFVLFPHMYFVDMEVYSVSNTHYT